MGDAVFVLSTFVAFAAACGAMLVIWRSLDDHSACPHHCPHRKVTVVRRRK